MADTAEGIEGGVRRLGLVGAMDAEVAALRPLIEGAVSRRLAGREFITGRLRGADVVLVRSGIGKVAAATIASLLLQAFDVGGVWFTGVAGGLGPGVRVGDLVVADQLLQHDMDASPLFPRWVVPGHAAAHFGTQAAWADHLAAAGRALLATPPAAWASFGLQAPSVHRGLVISGDRFVATAAGSRALAAQLPQALAVEMEGAALAQVCAEFGVPLAVLRVVSDRADDAAHADFNRFVAELAAPSARDIVCAALAGLPAHLRLWSSQVGST